MFSIEYWKHRAFHFCQRFPNEYDLWIKYHNMQKLRRYVNGQEWISDLTTGEYVLILDTPEEKDREESLDIHPHS